VGSSARTSIAVLPFNNLSGNHEQEYFADGMVEEIITALSRIRSLFVIARNSTFTYKGRAVDVKQVGRELGVRYVVEGSVRKSANRVRIAGQLIDASTRGHLWADHFDGTLDDIFELQDQMTLKVVGALVPQLELAEIERAKRKPTERLDAYDYFLRGMACVHRDTHEAHSEALQLFDKAIKFDPNFAPPHGMAAWCYVRRKSNGWMTDRVQEISAAVRLARRAVDLGNDDPVALCKGGHAIAFVAHDLDTGVAFVDRALVLNPNLALAWHLSGWVRVYLGEADLALDHLARAMRLNPLDPLIFVTEAGTAFAYFVAGRYDDALSWAEKTLRKQPNFMVALRVAAAAGALAGQIQEARRAMARMRQFDPVLGVSALRI
jgi:TolB-like protein